MILTIQGHTDQYVLDSMATRADCTAALARTAPHSERHYVLYAPAGATVSFRCERTIVRSR